MTQPGEVILDGEKATLRFERDFPQTPEQVWSALTDPAQLQQWYISEFKFDGRPGGTIEAFTMGRFRWTGRILAWEPPHVLEYEWITPPQPDLPNGEDSVVRYELSATASGTHLVLTHSRLNRLTALGFAPGTHAFMDRLAAHLAGEALPGWMHRYDEVKSQYPAWA